MKKSLKYKCDDSTDFKFNLMVADSHPLQEMSNRVTDHIHRSRNIRLSDLNRLILFRIYATHSEILSDSLLRTRHPNGKSYGELPQWNG